MSGRPGTIFCHGLGSLSRFGQKEGGARRAYRKHVEEGVEEGRLSRRAKRKTLIPTNCGWVAEEHQKIS
jgi:hypothetical protein